MPYRPTSQVCNPPWCPSPVFLPSSRFSHLLCSLTSFFSPCEARKQRESGQEHGLLTHTHPEQGKCPAPPHLPCQPAGKRGPGRSLLRSENNTLPSVTLVCNGEQVSSQPEALEEPSELFPGGQRLEGQGSCPFGLQAGTSEPTARGEGTCTKETGETQQRCSGSSPW